MRRANRVIVIALCSLTLGGCETSGFWDGANSASDRVQDMLGDFSPFGTAKKPLPGERRAVFPEGVPGVQQGVPSELMRNQQQQQQQALEAPPQPAPAPAPEPKAKTKKVAKKSQARTPAASDPSEDDVWPPPPSRR